VYDLVPSNAEVIVTKSEFGSSLLPIKLGASSQELAKNNIPARNAARKVLDIYSENDLRWGV
jgi:hypothetical protein